MTAAGIRNTSNSNVNFIRRVYKPQILDKDSSIYSSGFNNTNKNDNSISGNYKIPPPLPRGSTIF